MEKKKLIRVAIFIVSIIVMLILVENSIKGIGNLIENKKENHKSKEKEQIYLNSEEYKETVMLEKIVSDVVELLNNNEIDKIYNLIDADYKDFKFENKKVLFEKYIKEYINVDSKITLQTYEKISGRYVCRLLSEHDGKLKSFLALIIPNENSDIYSIIFDNITSIEKENKSIEKNNIKCEILYNVTAKQTLTYTVEFTNLGKSNVDYACENVAVKDTFGRTFESQIKDFKISLKPGERKRENITFYNGSIHSFPKTMLEFNLKNKNNEELKFDMYIEEGM